MSYFFLLDQSASSSLGTVFDSILSNIYQVLSTNPSANAIVFGDFNIYHKDWLTYSGGTDRSGELCYNFSTSNDLAQMVNFPTHISTVILTVLLFWISFFVLRLVFVLQWHWEILIVVVSVSFDFASYSQWGAISSHCL